MSIHRPRFVLMILLADFLLTAFSSSALMQNWETVTEKPGLTFLSQERICVIKREAMNITKNCVQSSCPVVYPVRYSGTFVFYVISLKRWKNPTFLCPNIFKRKFCDQKSLISVILVPSQEQVIRMKEMARLGLPRKLSV